MKAPNKYKQLHLIYIKILKTLFVNNGEKRKSRKVYKH